MKKRMLAVTLVLVALLVVTGCGKKETKDEKKASEKKITVTISAAASLEKAFEEKLIPEFEKKNPNIDIVGTYDGSGKLKTQIEQGAQVDVFMSAALDQMNGLVDGGFINKKDVTELLENQVVLIGLKGKVPTNIKTFKDIVNAKVIGIGDPASVPAGAYAKESLTNLKLWDQVNTKTVSLGTNVTEVLTWVSSGSVEVGIVYKSDAKTSDKVEIIDVAPADSVKKAIYPIAILKNSKEKDGAKKFIDYLKKDKSIKIFEEFGFKKASK